MEHWFHPTHSLTPQLNDLLTLTRRAIENDGPACCGFIRAWKQSPGDYPMRRLLPLAVIGLGLVAQTLPSAAQSAYTYPWCALLGDRSGAQSCYYTSQAQCRASLSGIGGSCIPNPYVTFSRPDNRRSYRY